MSGDTAMFSGDPLLGHKVCCEDPFSLEFLASKLRRYEGQRKIVLTGGTFDLLHVGHVNFLYEAKKLGDILVVGVNDDDVVRMRKGPNRPVIHERQRVEIVSNLKCVDLAFIAREPFSVRAVRQLKPTVLVLSVEDEKITINNKYAAEYRTLFPDLKLVLLKRQERGVNTSVTIHRAKNNAGTSRRYQPHK